MSEHTPGPWTAKVSPHDDRVVLINSKSHGAVGEVIYVDVRRAADARLIVAAPELLELVKRYRSETPLGHQPYMIADQADAVIAKATNKGGV